MELKVIWSLWGPIAEIYLTRLKFLASNLPSFAGLRFPKVRLLSAEAMRT